MPIWAEWLARVSEILSLAGQIIAVLIGLATLYKTARGASPTKLAKRKRKFNDALHERAQSVLEKFSIISIVALIVLGFAAAATHFIRPARADSIPLGIITPLPAPKRKKSADDAGDEGSIEDDELYYVDGAPVWFIALKKLLGQHEGSARKPNPVIAQLFQTAGFERFKNQSEIAWCSIGLCGVFEQCGIPSPKTTMARGWLKWGAPLDKPRVGCVIVLARGNDGVSGHVGLYAGEDDTFIKILGCNQSDAITLANFRKSRTRVLGYRWPRRLHELPGVKGGATGVVAAVGAGVSAATVIADQAQQVQEPLQSIGTPTAMRVAEFIGLACAIVGLAAAVYTVIKAAREHANNP